MANSTLFGLAFVALGFLFAPAGTSVDANRSFSPEAAEVQRILGDLTATPCDRHCTEYYCSNGHQSYDVGSGGTHGGSYHDCLYTEKACEYHGCGISLHPGELERLIDLVAALDREELLRLVDAEPVLVVNAERGALQVLGCDQRVVATMPLLRPAHHSAERARGIH